MITPQLLATSPVFADLPDADLARLVPLAEEIICPAGSLLFKEGEDASRLYILLSGKVNVQVQPIALTQAPPSYYTASAVCLEDSHLLAFDGAAFNRVLDENPVLGLVVMRRIAGVISQRLRSIQSIVLKNLYHHDEQ
jgi:CRP/FNR family cyclic AMP-dependent transcriptional regulator